MQPVSDLFRSERKLTRKPPAAKALGVVGVGVGGTVLDTQGAGRDMASGSSGLSGTEAPYLPLLALRSLRGGKRGCE